MVNISSDTLRYYDEIQLLNPDFINPSNNYRFYSEKQVTELLYIMDLKDCGFNLEEIKKFINLSEPNISQMLEKKKTELINQSKKINLSVKKIEKKLKMMGETHMKKNINILIVDDAPFMRMMLKDVLKKNGFENIIEADNGEDGVKKYKEYKPSLTMMDINMTPMNGIAAVKDIRQTDGTAKIIMLSAMNFPAHIAESFISGAVDFIAKPFSADKLIETVNKNLEEDVTLDTEKIKVWQTELQNLSEEAKIFNDNINEEFLSEKLVEVIKSSIDIKIDYNDLTKKLINTIKAYIDPALLADNHRVTQNIIDRLIDGFAK